MAHRSSCTKRNVGTTQNRPAQASHWVVVTELTDKILLSLQGETISSPALAAPGLMLLVGGLVTIAFNGQAAASRRQQEADNGESHLQVHST